MTAQQETMLTSLDVAILNESVDLRSIAEMVRGGSLDDGASAFSPHTVDCFDYCFDSFGVKVTHKDSVRHMNLALNEQRFDADFLADDIGDVVFGAWDDNDDYWDDISDVVARLVTTAPNAVI